MSIVRHLIASLIFFAALSTESYSQQTWDPEHEIPQMVHIGKPSPEEIEFGKQFRAGLVKNITYWRDRGMPDPTDLDGLFHFSSYSDVSVLEIITALNPEIKDIRQHVIDQYDALLKSEFAFVLSRVYEKVQKKEEKKTRKKSARVISVNPDEEDDLVAAIEREKEKAALKENNVNDWYNAIFDKYASIRYGFSVPHFYKAIVEGLTPAAMNGQPKSAEKYLFSDNAFFGRFPRIDLTEGLVPATSNDPKRKIPWSDSEYLTKGVFRLKDLTQRSQNLSFYSRRIVILPRSMENYGADISSLRDQTVGDHELGHHLNKFLAREKSLHRLVDEVLADFLAAAATDNPQIGAFFAQASGEVARRIAANSNGKLSDMDKKMIKAFNKIAEKGILRDLSENSDLDTIERFFGLPNDYDAGHPLRNFLWRLDHRSDVERAQFENLVLNTTEPFAALPKLTSRKADFLLMLRGLLVQLYHHLKVKEELKAMKIDPKDATKKEEEDATEKAEAKIGIEEAKRSEKARSSWSRNRPRVQADYVVPEYLRTMYRTSQVKAPELTSIVREEAEKTTNGSSMKISEGGGVQTLVFVKSSLDRLNLAARMRLWFLLRSMANKRAEFNVLAEKKDHSEEEEKRMTKLKNSYAKDLEHLGEYERTGSTFRLFFPHPVLATSLLAGKVGFGVAKIGLKVLGKFSKKEDCKKSVAQLR
jgi:hypothetical protein